MVKILDDKDFVEYTLEIEEANDGTYNVVQWDAYGNVMRVSRGHELHYAEETLKEWVDLALMNEVLSIEIE